MDNILSVFSKQVKEGEKKRNVYTCSAVLDDGSIVEMVHNPGEGTKFAIFKEGVVEYRESINLPNGKVLKPIPSDRDLIKNGVILFPTKAEEYGSEAELLKEIQGYIHKWVDISPIYEKIASYYPLFSWIYDCFNEVPYLRPLGDWGTGKSRTLTVVGSICYKPVFAGGAITSAPIFRILQEIRGTFVIDEADFRNSEVWSDIIKVLNVGYERRLATIIRCEGDKNEPKAFNVYGPKLLATRELFKDQALESRCLTIEMEVTDRDDIPVNLPDSFWEETTRIRNKMLLWRFRNYGKRALNSGLREKTIEPRLNQIAIPLLSIVEEEEARTKIKEFIKEYNQQLITDRGMSFEAEILEMILKILENKEEPLMQSIADLLNEKYGYDEKDKRRFTAKHIGSMVRKKLKLHPRRGMKGYKIYFEEYERIYRLADKFGVKKNLEAETTIEESVQQNEIKIGEILPE